MLKSLCCFWRNLTMKHMVHHSLVLTLIFVALQLECGFTADPPVISEFDFGRRMIFTDSRSNNPPYFGYLNFDPKNSSRIYIGAVDFLYRLDANNISIQSLKSDNLTAVPNFSNILTSSLRTCQSLLRSATPSYSCRNHIRAAFPTRNEIYICATGASSPQEFYLDYESLGFVALDNRSIYSVTSCPTAPDAAYTSLYVDQGRGTPNNLPAIFSSIGSEFNNVVYRSGLQWNRTSPTQFSGLQLQLSDAKFVASFEIDMYIFYFFREIAAETVGIGPVRYSRVARVCKNDYGSSLTKARFLTFVKATLNCSVGRGNDIPVYYHNLYDVWYDESAKTFYGLFMATQNGSWGSAICKYSYASVNDKFDKGVFLGQELVGAIWSPPSANKIPVVLPSSCQVNDTRSLGGSDQAFAITYNLMQGTVDQATPTPLYYNRDVGYSLMTVDVVQGFGDSYVVFCLYSAQRPDDIVRIVQWTRDGVVSSRIFSILKPFDDNKSTLREMTLRNIAGKSWLYIVKDTAVFQISMDACSQYDLCTECVIDPYCGWNSSSNKCVPYTTGLLQNVGSPSALTACSAVCKVSYSSSQFCIPGMAVHLNCSSYCSPEGNLAWLFPNGTAVPTADPNYIVTPSGGLVILNLPSDLKGTFRCVSDDKVLAEHQILASTCQYSADIQNIVAREYSNWCIEFEKYKTEYNNWLCSRENSCNNPFCKPNCLNS